ncbi:GEVED domain-containing protein [Rhodopirellula sp. JC639]|uniref:GEVED domain-containing protein n=1 Tax=Stieleria mannarensis TaxID=2755585 RepID=UPI001604649B|nr:GEVED domain-containing protein [Rhodopirellula sp. JC639]
MIYKPRRHPGNRNAVATKHRYQVPLKLELLEPRRLLAQLLLSTPDAMESDDHVTVNVSLAEAQAEPVEVLFDTIDSDAIGGRDFVAVTGQRLTFSPGQTVQSVDVALLDNALRDGDLSFGVRVSIVDDDGRRVLADLQWFAPPGDLFVDWLETSPDGSTIAYGARRLKSSVILSVPTDGSRAPIELARYDGDFYKTVQTHKFSADGKWLIYSGDLETDGKTDVYIVPADGSMNPIRVPNDLSTGVLSSFTVAPDGQRFVYTWKGDGEDASVMYSARLDDSSPAIPISNLSPFYNLVDFTPDGNSIVFQNRDGDDVQHYVAAMDGSFEPMQVATDVPGSTWGLAGKISPDGQTLAFTKRDPNASRITNLFTSRLDGKGESKRVAFDIGSSSYQFSSDGKHLVYRVDKGIVAPHEMFTVPVDGSAEPKILHPELTGSQWVEHGFRVIGEDVLFRSNFEDESAGYSTYLVPSDGSQPPRKLLAPIEDRTVDKITPSPDEKHIVFQAIDFRDPEDDLVEIYSIPLDGSRPPKKLNGDFVDGGTIPRFAPILFSKDGQDLYYFADQLVDDQLELFVVPVDGRSKASRASVPLPTVFDVSWSSVGATETGIAYGVREGSFAPHAIYSSQLHQSGNVRILDDEGDVADFGDAPERLPDGLGQSYPVTLSQNGARHNVTELFLGAGVDVDSDGHPAAAADHDDQDESDENQGVRWLSNLLITQTDTLTTMQVTASQAGKVSIWIDFDRDGDWGDRIDEVVIAHDVHAGDNLIPFVVPAGAIAGPTAARVRLSTSGETAPTGAAADGEVEDFWLDLVDAKSDPVPLVVNLLQPGGFLRLIADHVIVGNGLEPPMFHAEGDFSKVNVSLSPADDSLAIELGQRPKNKIAIQGNDETNRLAFHDLDRNNLQPLVLDFGESGDFQTDNVEIVDVADSERFRLPVDDLTSIAAAQGVTIVAASREQLQFNDRSAWRMGDTFEQQGKFYRQLVAPGTLSPPIVIDLPNPWQNVVTTTDVNNDGSTSEIDALIVINQIAKQVDVSGVTLPDPLSLAQWPGNYYDSNGDLELSPIDALVVINALARQAEGERAAEPEQVTPAVSQEFDPITDHRFLAPVASTVKRDEVPETPWWGNLYPDTTAGSPLPPLDAGRDQQVLPAGDRAISAGIRATSGTDHLDQARLTRTWSQSVDRLLATSLLDET